MQEKNSDADGLIYPFFCPVQLSTSLPVSPHDSTQELMKFSNNIMPLKAILNSLHAQLSRNTNTFHTKTENNIIDCTIQNSTYTGLFIIIYLVPD
jgi:hypothetical protein